MTYIWKTEYEVIDRDGNSTWFDDESEAIENAEFNDADQVVKWHRYADVSVNIWPVDEDGE